MHVRKTGTGPDRIALIGRVGDKTIIRRVPCCYPTLSLISNARAARLGTDDSDCDGRSQKKLPADCAWRYAFLTNIDV
jgi:hypothetical protein